VDGWGDWAGLSVKDLSWVFGGGVEELLSELNWVAFGGGFGGRKEPVGGGDEETRQ
jgi:hypothetical protein